MWSQLNKMLIWGIFSSVTFQTAVLGCETKSHANEFPSPNLTSNTNVVMMGQNISLFCSHKNKSLQVTYLLFLHKKHLETKKAKGEPAIFNLNISRASDSGPYKCKAQVFNCSKYSREFNFTLVDGKSCHLCLPLLIPGSLLILLAILLILIFWIRSKYKARKAMRGTVPKDFGDTSVEGELYANVYRKHPGTGQSQEIYYATPTFQEVAPREPEFWHDCKTDYTYSELTF